MSELALKELMKADILQIHLADSMQDVFPQLSEQPGRFVVVLDEENVPLYLTTAEDMRRKMPRSLDWPKVEDFANRLPEALLIDEDVPLDRAMVFFGTMSDSSPQPQGLVVMHNSQVIGVLPYNVLNDFYSENIVPQLQAEGKVVRAGQPVTVAHAVFQCRRSPRCDFEITVAHVDEPPLCGIQAAHGRTRLQA